MKITSCHECGGINGYHHHACPNHPGDDVDEMTPQERASYNESEMVLAAEMRAEDRMEASYELLQ